MRFWWILLIPFLALAVAAHVSYTEHKYLSGHV